MNKFLAEQLLQFNRETGDRFGENWGSVLNFLHDEHVGPDQIMSAQDASIYIFKKQLKEKEKQLLGEKVRRDSIKKQTTETALSLKYQNEEQQRVQALIQKAKLEGHSLHLPAASPGDANKQNADDDPECITAMSRDYCAAAEPIIDLAQDFQVKVGPIGGNRMIQHRGANSLVQIQKGNREQKRSESEEPLQHIDDLRYGESQVSKREIITEKQEKLGSLANLETVQEYCDEKINHEHHSQKILEPTSSLQKKTSSHLLDSCNLDLRIYRSNTSDNKASSCIIKPQLSFVKPQDRSNGKQDEAYIDDFYSPYPVNESIDLNNLKSLNLRKQLISRLQNFNDNKQNSTMEKNSIDISQIKERLIVSKEASGQSGLPRSKQVFTHNSPQLPLCSNYKLNQHTDSRSLREFKRPVQANCAEQQVNRSSIFLGHRYSLNNSQQATMSNSITMRQNVSASKPLRDSAASQDGITIKKTNSSTFKAIEALRNSKLAVRPCKVQLKTTKICRFKPHGRRINAQQNRESGLTNAPTSSGSVLMQSRQAQKDHRLSEPDIEDLAIQQRLTSSQFEGLYVIPSSYTRQWQQKPKPKDPTTYTYQNTLRVVTTQQSKHRNRIQAKSVAYNRGTLTQTSFNKQNLDYGQQAQNYSFGDTGTEKSFSCGRSLPIKEMQRASTADEYSVASLVPLPNQSNAFFASGGNWIDPTNGELEELYNQSRRDNRFIDHSEDQKSQQDRSGSYWDETQLKKANYSLDRTNMMLKQLKMMAPRKTNVNQACVRRINSTTKDKVSYAYKERYCGIYEEKKRAKQLKRDDSWEKFVNPVNGARVGFNNHLQQVYNTVAQQDLIVRQQQQNQQQEEEEQNQNWQGLAQDKKNESGPGSQTVNLTAQNQTQGARTNFRNDLERFHYQFDQENVQNINDLTTWDRIQKANKRFDSVIQRAKPTVKLYNLLGYSRTQYILFRQIQHWMRRHKYSDKKQVESVYNIQFARDFFASIDENDSGAASLNELAVPMITLGLSSDSEFIKKVMQAVNPQKFGKKAKKKQGNAFKEDGLTLKDFIKIFKKDQVSENLTEMLISRIISRRKDLHFAQKRASERYEQQLSIVQDHVAYKVLSVGDTEDEVAAPGCQSGVIEIMGFANKAHEDSSSVDFQREERESVFFDGQQRRSSGFSQLKESSVRKEPSVKDVLKQISQISVNDLLQEVRAIWFELDEDRGMLELDLHSVCQLLCNLKVMQDISSAHKYIQTTIQSKTKLLDYDDFNSIFCKGIFRHAVASKAQDLDQDLEQDEKVNPEDTYDIKLRRKSRLNLTSEIKKGHTERVDQPAEFVTRPILSQLWQIFYKNIPREQRETYEQFFDRMQGLTNEIIEDPTIIQLDAFSQKFSNPSQVPAKSAMSIIAKEHAQMAKNPYKEDIMDFQPIHQSSRSSLGKSQGGTKYKSTLQKQNHRNSEYRKNQPINSIESSPDRLKKERQQTQKNLVKKLKDQGTDFKMSFNKSFRNDQPENTKSKVINSQRTEPSSAKKNATSSVDILGKPQKTALHPDLDLQLSTDIEQLALQRKKRFEQLRQLQSLMERTSIDRPPGQDYLEEIQERKEQERRKRIEEAEQYEM